MIRILIVDDEQAARERLTRMVAELDGEHWQTVGLCENGRQAVDFCQQNEVDVVLMDVRMPVMDGIAAAAELASLAMPPVVILTTAFAEYALEAFDAEARAYLLKPIKKEKLQNALERAEKTDRVQQQIGEPRAVQQPAYVSGQYRGATLRVPLDEVIYFLAEDKYVTAFTNDRQLLLDEPLKELEQRYAGRVTRIHRNALVLTSRLAGIEKKKDSPVYALLAGSEQRLEISRRHVSTVRDIICNQGNCPPASEQ
jgi:two-component system response regulator AlgR